MNTQEIVILICFLILIIFILIVDLGVFHKKNHEVGFKEALGFTTLWVTLALIFWGLIYFYGDWIHGPENFDDLKNLVIKYGHPIKLVDNDFEDMAEHDKLWEKLIAKEEWGEFIEEWDKLRAGRGKHEIWNLE